MPPKRRLETDEGGGPRDSPAPASPHEEIRPPTPLDPVIPHPSGGLGDAVPLTEPEQRGWWVIPPDREPTEDEWWAAIGVTPERAAAILAMDQGGEAWKRSRQGRATCSKAGAYIGLCPYARKDGPRKVVNEHIRSTFHGNFFTERGQRLEPMVRDKYTDRLRAEMRKRDPDAFVSVVEQGLFIDPARPWMGGSIDGLVDIHWTEDGSYRMESGLIEIKAPMATWKPMDDVYWDRMPAYMRVDPAAFRTDPPQYVAQMQSLMYLRGLPWCDFVVWRKTGAMVVRRHPYDREWTEGMLIPRCEAWYRGKFLPTALAYERAVRGLGPCPLEDPSKKRGRSVTLEADDDEEDADATQPTTPTLKRMRESEAESTPLPT